MNKKVSVNSKRRIVNKKLLNAGVIVSSFSVLPQQWSRPVVRTVLLPAHAQTSPNTASTAACMITGTQLIDHTSILSSGPYDWTVTNTGNVPLTGSPISPTGIVFSGAGTLGGIGSSGNNIAISSILNPGEVGIITANTISTINCPIGGGMGDFQVFATFNETSCSLLVNVTCTPVLTPSDRRLKRDIRLLWKRDDDVNIYSYKYIWSDREKVGVMAQDLLENDRYNNAVVVMPNGFYAVDYSKIGNRFCRQVPALD